MFYFKAKQIFECLQNCTFGNQKKVARVSIKSGKNIPWIQTGLKQPLFLAVLNPFGFNAVYLDTYTHLIFLHADTYRS